jgi:ABC-type uncharacterized transport system involved in gliding motility auxiliary subunit
MAAGRTIAGISGAAGLTGLAAALVAGLVAPDRTWIVWAGLGVGAAGLAGFIAADPRAVVRALRARSTRQGASVTVAALAMTAILAVLNYVAVRQDARVDLTQDRIFSLSDQTLKVLAGLDAPVRFLAFYAAADPSGTYDELRGRLELYRGASDRVTFEFVDPYRNPLAVKTYNITEDGPRVVVTRGDEEARAKEITEEALTNALIRVVSGVRKKVYVVGGHGEPGLEDTGAGGWSFVAESIRDEGYDVSPAQLVTMQELPQDAAVVILAGAEGRLLDPELKVLADYLDRGGHALVLLEPGVDAGLTEVLGRWGVTANNDIVVDELSRVFNMGASVPVINVFDEEHPITQGFDAFVLMPTTRSLEAATDTAADVLVLARSSPTSFATTKFGGAQIEIDPQTARRGPVPVALVARRAVAKDAVAGRPYSAEARLLVVGDSEFVSNQFFGLAGNRDLFLNMVNWLGEQEDRISIRPRRRATSSIHLTPPQEGALALGTLAVIPLALAGLGFVTYARKRNG